MSCPATAGWQNGQQGVRRATTPVGLKIYKWTGPRLDLDGASWAFPGLPSSCWNCRRGLRVGRRPLPTRHGRPSRSTSLLTAGGLDRAPADHPRGVFGYGSKYSPRRRAARVAYFFWPPSRKAPGGMRQGGTGPLSRTPGRTPAREEDTAPRAGGRSGGGAARFRHRKRSDPADAEPSRFVRPGGLVRLCTLRTPARSDLAGRTAAGQRRPRTTARRTHRGLQTPRRGDVTPGARMPHRRPPPLDTGPGPQPRQCKPSGARPPTTGVDMSDLPARRCT